MNEVLKFLTDCKTFYFATIENNEPRVRPFGFLMEHEGKLYLCTNNTKDVYKQLQANPNFELTAMNAATYEWVRVKGKAIFDKTLASKAKAFEVAPFLTNMYKTPENPIFEVFYIADGVATFYSMSTEPRTVKL